MARKEPQLTAAAIVAVGGALTIGGFFFFQYVLHLPPCPLCLEQRTPYYFSVPLAVMLLLGANHGASSKVMIAGFAVITAFMLWDCGLAVYHAGVEWKLWQGPIDCSGPINKFGAASDIFKRLDNIERGPLRRGALALPRPLARRLERAGVAGAGRRRRLGRAGLAREAKTIRLV